MNLQFLGIELLALLIIGLIVGFCIGFTLSTKTEAPTSECCKKRKQNGD